MSVAADALEPAQLRLVEDALRSFGRTFRAFQMYLPNNPTRARSLDETRKAFRQLWTCVDGISLAVTATSLTTGAEVVLQDDERGASGLPWLMYRDGLRRLDIDPGFEETEIEQLLEILIRARSASPDDDDLITLLWVADFSHLQYRHVDLYNEADAIESGGEHEARVTHAEDAPAQQRLEADMPDGAPPAFVRIEEFEQTLHFLDRNEVEYLQDALAAEYAGSREVEAVAALFDIVEQAPDLASRKNAVQCIDQVLLDALAGRRIDVASMVLREARIVTTQRRPLDDSVNEVLAAIVDRVSEPAALTQLLEAIDSAGALPPVQHIEELFAELRSSALAPLLAWLAYSAPSHARDAIERATVRLASRNVSELGRQLTSASEQVVRSAARIAMQVSSPGLVSGLASALGSAPAGTRVDVIAALGSIGTPQALQAVERAIEDESRDVRIAALKTVAERRHAGALGRLQALVQKKSLRNADLSEKMAAFEAYGLVSGDAGIDALDGILNGRGLIGFRESPELRACAAHALGLIGSERARSVLRKASDVSDVVVRSAVARALRAGAR